MQATKVVQGGCMEAKLELKVTAGVTALPQRNKEQ